MTQITRRTSTKFCLSFDQRQGLHYPLHRSNILQNRWTNDIIKFFHFTLALLLGFTLGTIIFRWTPDLPVLQNPYEIDSPLVRQNIDPLNNTLRFGILILCPLLFWFILDRLLIRFLPRIRSRATEKIDFWDSTLVWNCALAMALFLGFSYLAFTFSFPDFKLDGYYFFHEGEWLGPAWKWHAEKKLWLGSFFAHGAYYDALSSALSWKIFGTVSIGASRIFTNISEVIIFPAAMIMIVSLVVIAFSEEKKQRSRATFVLLCICSYFVGTYTNWHNFERRDILVILGFPLFLHGLIKQNRISLFLAATCASLSWFYSIDRGAYFTFSIFFIPICIAIFTRDPKRLAEEMLVVLSAILITGSLMLMLFGREELLAGFHTTKHLLQIKDLSDGSKYPAPGFPILNLKFLLTRHTVPLVNLCVQFLFFGSYLIRNKFRLKREAFWMVEFSLLAIALIYYRGALSRCDEVHYRYVASFGFIGAAFSVASAISLSHAWQNKISKLFLIGACLFVPILKIRDNSNLAFATFPNIRNYKTFVQKPDSDFLFEWEKETLQYLEREFKNEPCIYSMVSEPLWPYLLRKSACGKFHLMWLISDRRLQMEAIAEFASYTPQKILMHTPRSGDEMDGILIEDRVKYLYRFISERYEPHSEFNGWEVWKKKKN